MTMRRWGSARKELLEHRKVAGSKVQSRDSVRTLAIAAWIIFAAATLIVAGFMAWAAYQARNSQLSEARQTTQNLARVIEQNTVRSFEAVALLLRLVEFRLTQVTTDETGRPPWNPQQFRTEVFGTVPFIASIQAVDPRTMDIIFRMDQAGGEAPYRLPSEAVSEAMNKIEQNPRDIVVGRPIRSAGGRWILPVSRKLDRPISRAAEVFLTAYVSLDHLQEFYDRIDIGNGSIALLADDLNLLVRRPRIDALVGNFVVAGRAAEILRATTEQTAEGRSAADGIVRIVSSRHVEGWPFIVAATLDRSEVLQPIHNALVRNFAIAVFFAIFLGLALHRLIRIVDQRARAEYRSFRQAEIFRSILDHMAQGLMMARADGKMAVYNARAIQLLGLPKELLDTRPTSSEVLAWQAANGEFGAADVDAMRRLNPFSGSTPSVYQRMRPNGTWLEITTVPLPEGGVIRTYTDISKRKAAEIALEQSEERYRILTETTSDTITRLSLDFKREYVSPNCAKIFGFAPEEMVGEQPSTSIHPLDADGVRTFAAELLAGRIEDDRGTVTYRTRHKKGHWVWVEAAMTLARDPSSRAPTAIVCSLRDTTDRRLAEEALQESEARFRLLAENATDVIARINLDLRRSYVSPSSREVLGYEPEELLAAPIGQIVHPHDVPAFRQCLSALQTGETEQGSCNYRCKRKDGKWIWMESHFRLLKDAKGNPFEILASGRDVTDRQLYADELRAAKERAEAGSKAKSDFVATISHEIRTPLNSVIGFSSLLLERDDLPADVVHQLGIVKGAGSALLNVVNDVLDFSRIEAGALVVEDRTFVVRALAEECVAMMQRASAEKSIELQLSASEDVPEVLFGDDGLVRQVLLNLLNNAVKFTAKGHVKISIDMGVDNAIRFSVEDTGPGIPASKHGALFKEFSQVDTSHNRTFGGAGLGLAICKRIVERLGGTIGVESKAGAGSRFWFELPLAAATSSSAGIPFVQADEMDRGLKILVVDDMAVNRELVVAILQSAGHEVEAAADGASALELTQHAAYGVILMDIQMPGMDGLETAKRIRQSGGPSASAPIVALTANAYAEQVNEYAAAGMHHHIAKPFTPQALRAKVIEIARWDAAERVAPDRADGEIPVLDEGIASELIATVGIDRALMLYRMFLIDIEGSLRTDAAVTDGVNIASVAHKLTGSAGLLGLVELELAARVLAEKSRSTAEIQLERTRYSEAQLKARAAVQNLICRCEAA
jgi:PAS domain S-box-containing protein